MAVVKYYKLTNRECCHNGFQYKEGINTDTRAWNTGECLPGGIYIVRREHFTDWISYRDDLYYVWDAEPVGSLVCEQPDNKVKCHSVRLWNCRPITEMEELQTEEGRLAAVFMCCDVIRFIENPSLEAQLQAVRTDGRTIQYIKDPDELIQQVAVRENGNAVRYIEAPSEMVQLEAVCQNPLAISHIQAPSEAVQLEAVKRTPIAIADITDPCRAVQIAAIRKDYHVTFCIKKLDSEARKLAQLLRERDNLPAVRCTVM